MPMFFKYKEILIYVIGLLMVGIGEAQATNGFHELDSHPIVTSNSINSDDDSVYHVGFDDTHTEPDGRLRPMKYVASANANEQIAAGNWILGEWFIGNSNIAMPLSAELYGVAGGSGGNHPGLWNQAASKAPIPYHKNPMHPERSTMAGDLEASPVPLPAAVWSFLFGFLGILGLKKRQRPASE